MTFHIVMAIFMAWVAGLWAGLTALDWVEYKPRREILRGAAWTVVLLGFAIAQGFAA